MTEKEKMLRQMMYDANNDTDLIEERKVVKDIPSDVVAVGNPCRVVRPITYNDKLKSWDRE